MSREIDERIVQMTFDNQQFERGVKTTMGTISKLKKNLQFDDAASGLEEIQNAVNHIDFSNVVSGSAAAIAKFTVISNLVTDIQRKAESMVKSLTIDPISSGWSKYAEITSATQTIMSATAKDFADEAEQMEVVTEQLSKLNWFTDETSYSLTDMTSNIGKFTSNGVKLETAVTAMEGISTWAAKSGANVGEASRAMYNLSQALAVGSVKLIDWKSIENANMATAEFKEQAIDTAIALGTLTKAEDGVIRTLNGHEVSVTNFNENLSDAWFSSDVLLKVLDRYGSFADKLQTYTDETGLLTSKMLSYIDDYKNGTIDIEKVSKSTGVTAERLSQMLEELGSVEYELGRKSFAAAQEAKTFQEAIDATKDAVSTGWMTTFQTIFGNYLEAKKVWTRLANELWDIFAAPGERRNDILSVWAEQSGRTKLFEAIENVWEPIKASIELFREIKEEVFPAEEIGKALASMTKRLADFTSKFKMNEEMVSRVSNSVFRLVKSVKNLLSPLGTISSKVFPILGKGLSVVVDVASVAIDKFTGVLEVVTAAFARIMHSAIGSGIQWLVGVFTNLKNAIVSWIETIRSIELPGWMQSIVDWFQGVWNWLKAFGMVEDPVEEVAESAEKSADRIRVAYKSVKDLALEIIRGDWGNGSERDNLILAAGYDNDLAQDVVNQIWTLTGEFKEGYQEILDSYENVSAVMNGGILDTKDQKKSVKFLKKTGLLIDEIKSTSEQIRKVPAKSFTEVLSESKVKFLEKLPGIMSKIGAAAAKVKIKAGELAGVLNAKLGVGIEKLVSFFKKWEPDIKNFLTTLWEKLKNLGSIALTGLGTGWERIKSVFSGLAPIFEDFFAALLRFDLKGMGAAILEFFGTIGSKISEGVATAVGIGKDGIERIGNFFSDIFNTVSILFGGKSSQNPEEMGQLSWLGSAGETLSETMTEFTAAIEKGEVPSESVFSKLTTSFDGILSLFKNVSVGLTTFRLGKMLKGFGEMGSGIGEFFETLSEGGPFKGDFWKNAKSLVKAYNRRDVFSKIKDVAISFAVVALAVAALGYIPEDKLNRGLETFKTIIEGLLGIFTLSKLGDWLTKDIASGNSLLSMAKAMLSIAVALAVMFFAVWAFSQLDPEDLKQGLEGVGIVLAGLGTVLTIISKMNNGSIQLKGVASTLIGLAIAVAVLYFAVSGFGKMKFDQLGQGLLGVIVVLAALGSVIGVLTTFNNGSASLKAAGTVLALAFAVLMLMIPISAFALMDFYDLLQGVGGVVVVLVALGVALHLIQGLNASFKSVVATLAYAAIMIASVGAICWLINQWPINIPQAIAVGILLGIVAGLGEAFQKLQITFSAVKSAFWAAVGFDAVVGTVVGGIVALLEIIQAVDEGLEVISQGHLGIKAFIRKVGDCIKIIGESVGEGAKAIAEGFEACESIDPEKVNPLVLAMDAAARIYEHTSALDALVSWFTGNHIDKANSIKNTMHGISVAFTELALDEVDDSSIKKLTAMLPIMDAVKDLIEATSDKTFASGSVDDVVYSIEGLFDAISEIDLDKLNATEKALGNLSTVFAELQGGTTINPLSDAFISFVRDSLVKMADEFDSDEASSSYSDGARYLSLGLQTAIDNQRISLERKAKRIVGWISEAINSVVAEVQTAGMNIMAGLQAGINNKAPSVFSTASAIALRVASTISNALKIHSPSEVTEAMGEYVSLGLAKGIANGQDIVESSTLSVVDGVRSVASLVSEALNEELGPVITPVLDLSNVSRGAGMVGGMFGTPNLTPSLSIANARAVSMESVSPNNGFSNTNSSGAYQQVVYAIGNVQSEVARLSEVINNMQVVMDGGALVGSIATKMDGALGKRVVYQSRRN